ncbi:LPXTG cell wall anchor domain-containing protein [Glycomyces sp. NPDC048151]|uniref:LPXTG cell wall anchor domain-containing protein n=1 Tax=Glycomyces sp. NPDC048151 TaxID=3364002 RepID=UPI0037197B55
MSLKSFLRGTVFAGASAFLIAIPMTASASHGEDVDVSINPGNIPTTAEDFGGGCDNLPELGEFEDGWVFVLPAEGDPDAHFISLSATFEDNEGNEQTLGGTLVEGSGDNKAFVVAEAGWTLIGASAVINTVEGGADSFNLTHACPGTVPPPEEPPPEEPPPEEPPPEEPPPEEPPPEEPPPEEPPPEEPPPEEPPAEEPPAEEPPAEEPPAAQEPPAEEEAPMQEEQEQEEQEEAPAPEQEESEPPAQLPKTGEELTGLLLAAGALTAAGLGAYLFGRRRGPSGTS